MVPIKVNDSQAVTLITTLKVDVGDAYAVSVVKSFHFPILQWAVDVEGLATDCLKDQDGRG